MDTEGKYRPITPELIPVIDWLQKIDNQLDEILMQINQINNTLRKEGRLSY